jgi:hypothetical protein
LGSVLIDPSLKTTCHTSWAKRLFGADTVVKIKQTAGMGWEREILGAKENCGEEFGLLQFK